MTIVRTMRRKKREHTSCNNSVGKIASKISCCKCGQILRCFSLIAEIDITRQFCIPAYMLDLASCAKEGREKRLFMLASIYEAQKYAIGERYLI